MGTNFYSEQEKAEKVETIDFRLKPDESLIEEKMNILYDFGVFTRSKEDKILRKQCVKRLKECKTVLGLEKTTQDIIRESFDRFDKVELLMVK